MATDHSLRFSLKESVWFQKGQEVEELLSISLDPDVEIEELDHEVIVRGQLDLTGEYVARQDDSAYSLRDLSPAKSINYVETREDGVNELVHSFPLEISIPRNRVKVIEELYVSIEEFDYELKENGCLQLLADISITGLCDEERIEDEEEEKETAYAELEVDSAQEDENRPTPQVEEPAYKESDEWEDYAFEPFQLEERKEQEVEEEEIEEHEFVEHEEEKETTPQFELFGRKDFKKEKAKKQEEQEEETYSQRDENALYLTKLFTKEPEEEFTKLRMYFVQEGDTIESVAERYETSVQNLYRVNQTEDIYLTTGQIIYIPVSRAKAK
ncbi:MULTISPECIES: stage VI sporulation protein D [Bacillus cereus group]|uniref:stage VI sporulation protein D n=1 Tax=Bacillus cereus group TaxID=86661 RepID=UPI0022E2AFDE|nr:MULTISPECIES: stage VI sporulation protein D [unclassified Bacillus cereus group]MDA2663716.1 stage VI sporulation protein D [Bacillus cereus group sp. Bc032]MDA2674434.1 stage VI sporulation protein D [Bacillus cereus group sp. Bc031]MDA2679799.1 stage VI sporulation protein D [Bacillus cereus group sp. Bc029]MDA2685385.1 stage VI sporulation protein D [Bacillus cereus group sp. Bc030]MDA2740781.1 stage VI sporulation protein D [Bacillus cereus group sp. Bc011]